MTKSTNEILRVIEFIKYADEALDMAIEALEQEPNKSRWIVTEEFGFGNICECSNCKENVWVYKNTNKWNYCPKCGLKMEDTNNDK